MFTTCIHRCVLRCHWPQQAEPPALDILQRANELKMLEVIQVLQYYFNWSAEGKRRCAWNLSLIVLQFIQCFNMHCFFWHVVRRMPCSTIYIYLPYAVRNPMNFLMMLKQDKPCKHFPLPQQAQREPPPCQWWHKIGTHRNLRTFWNTQPACKSRSEQFGAKTVPEVSQSTSRHDTKIYQVYLWAKKIRRSKCRHVTG